ncbi:hypothetical protein CLV62_12068 [Dysgonomonas alginatilytica]|uniref:Uncharacterized protein n=1 Tax=Dysgonomonas alginatilytica TaxID=1605892 RepID=A0A2V3PN21_9BACT|nr:hypothetical protein [Dysgonomonas alginatilytica]PXV62379.1 hypothetical protein CLV62_12068 [Dysgonomonas alginatilytica]
MNQPTIEDEKLLLSIQENDKDELTIPRTKKKYMIGWMKGFTLERLSKLELMEGVKAEDEDSIKIITNRSKFLSKAASLCLLNGLKIKFFHWIYWRYLYYVKGYSFDQLEPIIILSKKKVPAGSWYIGSALVSQMKITNMTMTTEEVQRFRRELSSEQEPPSEKTMLG